jgi:hypothetical protein
MTPRRSLGWYDLEDVDDTPEVTVTISPDYRPGDYYEFGPVGSNVPWGDYVDPAQYPPELIDHTDVFDDVTEVWVRPCAWTAMRNTGGIMAVSR